MEEITIKVDTTSFAKQAFDSKDYLSAEGETKQYPGNTVEIRPYLEIRIFTK